MNVNPQSIIYRAEAIVAQKGYDSFNIREITFNRSGMVAILFSAEDDFQEHVKDRVHSGYFLSASGDTVEEALENLSRIPSRKMRELMFMVQQAESLGHLADKLKTEQVKLFVEELLESAAEFRNLIADGRK